MNWIKASERLPSEKGSYFMRHPYGDGRMHGWWWYVVPDAIDKDYWVKMDYEWLDEDAESPIEYALAEGANLWKLEYDDCRRILRELVELKVVKDAHGKTEEYVRRKDVAWKKAVEFLSQYQHQLF